MSNIIDADKMNKIIYYATEAEKSYKESLRQKQISKDFLHKACKLILNDVNKIEIYNTIIKEDFTYSKDKDGKITLEE